MPSSGLFKNPPMLYIFISSWSVFRGILLSGWRFDVASLSALSQVLFVQEWWVRRRKRWCIWPPRMQVTLNELWAKWSTTLWFFFFLSQFDLLLLPDQNLIVMSCGSTRRLPKSRPSGGRLWFWSALRVSAVVAWRTNCWCQIPNAMAPQSPVSKAIITRRHTHQ